MANIKKSSYWINNSDISKYLLPYLSPTTPGTKYWESQPSGKLTDRQVGRICLQVHQLVEKIEKTKGAKKISFLDIGTGNGFIPRLIPYFKKVEFSHGCDPFLDGDHQTGFQKHNRDNEFLRILEFMKSVSNKKNVLNFNDYSKKTSNEHFYGRPLPVQLIFNDENDSLFKFFQVGAHDLAVLENSYNFLYCKAIEHIQNWPLFFEKAFENSSNDAIFYLKHKSFFSYLGAHRYGSTGIAWGHLRMTEKEYENYVDRLFPDRSKLMKKFYFDDLAYPRNTVGEMIQIASSKGWKLGSVEYERSKNIESFQQILFSDESYIYKEIKDNFDVSVDELLSGLIHITFTK